MNTRNLKRNPQGQTVAAATTTSTTRVVHTNHNEPAVGVRASKRRKVATNLLRRDLRTRAVDRESEGLPARGVVAGHGVPDWFGPAIEAALAPVFHRLDNLEARLVNVEARQFNSVACYSTDRFDAIANAEGIPAPNFPRTILEFMNMETAELTAFLKHYGLPVPRSDREKRQSIKQFIGRRIDYP